MQCLPLGQRDILGNHTISTEAKQLRDQVEMRLDCQQVGGGYEWMVLDCQLNNTVEKLWTSRDHELWKRQRTPSPGQARSTEVGADVVQSQEAWIRVSSSARLKGHGTMLWVVRDSGSLGTEGDMAPHVEANRKDELQGFGGQRRFLQDGGGTLEERDVSACPPALGECVPKGIQESSWYGCRDMQANLSTGFRPHSDGPLAIERWSGAVLEPTHTATVKGRNVRRVPESPWFKGLRQLGGIPCR